MALVPAVPKLPNVFNHHRKVVCMILVLGKDHLKGIMKRVEQNRLTYYLKLIEEKKFQEPTFQRFFLKMTKFEIQFILNFRASFHMVLFTTASNRSHDPRTKWAVFI